MILMAIHVQIQRGGGGGGGGGGGVGGDWGPDPPPPHTHTHILENHKYNSICANSCLMFIKLLINTGLAKQEAPLYDML